jgi:N-acetylmuramoyl-L-alanine amidase
VIRTRLPHSFCLSPNIEPRPAGVWPSILLLHYTGMESAEAACRWLCTPHAKVSCHYLVDEHGGITQMVGEEMRAWHAGVSFWAGERDINSHSVGIEIHNPGHSLGYPDFPDAQMQAVIALSMDIVARHDIRPECVLAHSDVAPRRKIDPGEKFDWRRLHEAGVGLWVKPEPASGEAAEAVSGMELVAAFQRRLGLYGYDISETGEIDSQTSIVVRAFQRHFRPDRVDGIIDRSTVVTLERLLARRGIG